MERTRRPSSPRFLARNRAHRVGPEGDTRVAKGSRVVIFGLRHDTLYNQQVGTVAGFDKQRGRYFVELSRNCERCVLQKNIRVLPPDAGDLNYLTVPRGILNADVLSHADAIVLESDCVATSPSTSLMRQSVEAYPHSPPCLGRTPARAGARYCVANPSTPGTAEIVRSADDSVTFAYLYTQWMPGLPRTSAALPPPKPDTAQQRRAWFRASLDSLLSKLPERVASIAFPLAVSDTAESRERAGLLSAFASANPQLRVFAVDGGGFANISKSASAAEAARLRNEAIAAASSLVAYQADISGPYQEVPDMVCISLIWPDMGLIWGRGEGGLHISLISLIWA